jgi:hypothetical protein
MKVVADECVDEEIVQRLRKDEHEVSYVAEQSPGILDEDVLILVDNDNTLLLTADKDFGELIFRQGWLSAAFFYIALRDCLNWKKPKLFPWRLVIMQMSYFILLAYSQRSQFAFARCSELFYAYF